MSASLSVYRGCLVLACVFVSPASAQERVTWNHSDCTAEMTLADVKCTPLFPISAQPGEMITLTITNTCPDDFDYTVVSLPVQTRGALQAAVPCTGTKVVDIRHDPQYGGYVVNIVNRTGRSVAAGNARVTISVRTEEWRIGFAGGFTANGLVDPPYALRSFTTGAGDAAVTRYVLVEQESRKDEVGRSVVSFVHVHHSKVPLLGLSFGLGVEPDRGGDYYAGPSLLFGDRAALTVGAVLGQVRSPPAGRAVDDTLDDANALANLGRRRIAAWFVGLSYRFLGGGQDDLRKPFLGQAQPGVSGATAATGTTPPALGGPTPGATVLQVTKEGDRQNVRPGRESQPLTIRAPSAPGAVVTWSVDPGRGVIVTGANRTDAAGVATATVTVGAAAVDGPVRIRARVCSARDPGSCGDAIFELTIRR